MLTLRWQKKRYRFAVEMRSLWTPKVITTATDKARKAVARTGLNPLILVPYLAEKSLLDLESQQVSGMDLCGNCVVLVPGELLVLRTGSPNRYGWESAIKNVYRWNSSVVARVFLAVTKFESVNAVLDEIKRRGGNVTIGTVSKVCKRLADDLIIERSENALTRPLSLLQADKLLDLLEENYQLPVVRQTFRGKCSLPIEQLLLSLSQWEAKSGGKVVRTGESSVEAYAVMAREPMQSFYCTDLKQLLQLLKNDVSETERFANVTFRETRDDLVYFDRRSGLLAAPVQCFLELAKGDKRDKETADQVRRLLLAPSSQEQ
jgi:hypothetical protein